MHLGCGPPFPEHFHHPVRSDRRKTCHTQEVLHNVLETQVQLFWARLLQGITTSWKDEADESTQAVPHDTPLHLYTLPPSQHPQVDRHYGVI